MCNLPQVVDDGLAQDLPELLVPSHSGLVLRFGGIRPAEIEAGVAMVAEVLE